MTSIPDPSAESILGTLIARGLIPEGDVRIESASGGLNSSVFFVRDQNGRGLYTVRTSVPGREPLLQREAEVLTRLSGASCCAPEIAGFIPASDNAGVGILVHRYVPGSTADLDTLPERQLALAGTCLGRLHANMVDHYAIWPKLVEVRGTRAQAYVMRVQAISRYAALNDTSNPTLHRRLQHAFHQLQSTRLRGDGWDETTFSLLHGDLSLGNLIWDDDRLTLIDWEYHRPGDPAEDLAYLLAEQDVSQDRVNEIFGAYVAAGGDATAISRVPDFAALVSLDSALWWAEYHQRAGTNPADGGEIEYHLARALQALS